MQSFQTLSENKEFLTGLCLKALLSHTLLKASCVSIFEEIRQGIYKNITVINSSRLVAEFTCRRNTLGENNILSELFNTDLFLQLTLKPDDFPLLLDFTFNLMCPTDGKNMVITDEYVTLDRYS